jgi:hypothetical protein
VLFVQVCPQNTRKRLALGFQAALLSQLELLVYERSFSWKMATSWWSGGAGIGYVNIRPDDSDPANEKRSQGIVEAPIGWGVAYATQEGPVADDSPRAIGKIDSEIEDASRKARLVGLLFRSKQTRMFPWTAKADKSSRILAISSIRLGF